MLPYPDALWQILLMIVLLITAVINAVYQAEVIAHKTGEPFGTIVLAVCVTIIEVALIVSIMLSAGADGALIARDSVFAAVMIVMNGVIGISIFLGGLRHRVLSFRVEGSNSSLGVLIALAIMTLVLPNFTTATAVAFVSIVFDMPLSLGIDALGMTFLGLTFLLSILTIAVGRATVLQGAVHLVVFAAYLFLSLVP